MPRPRIPDRRRRILAAARELALTRSWPRTTVADIAELAGVGKGAVYLEFPSRDAILDAVLTAAMRDLTAAVHRRCRAHEGLLDLPAVYRIGIEELLAEPLLRAVQLGDEDVLGAHVHTVDPARYRTRMDWLGQYVAALQDAGVLRKDVDREVLGQVLGTFTLGLLSAPAVLGDLDEQRLRESVALFADLVGRGLETDAEADPVAARTAQQHMLDQLTAQLETQEHS